MIRLTRLLCALLLLPAVGSAQEPTLAFVDEASSDSDLVAWRAHLLAGIARKDTAVLLAAISPNILNSFGGDGGIEEFKAKWGLTDRPADSEVWHLLERLLTAGGAFFNGEFVAPFYMVATPTPPVPPDLDAFETSVVLGSNVRVRTGPAPNAPILTTLSNALVRLRDRVPSVRDSSGGTWEAITLIIGGQDGWVATRYLYSSVGYRLAISGYGATRAIRVLVAGD